MEEVSLPINLMRAYISDHNYAWHNYGVQTRDTITVYSFLKYFHGHYVSKEFPFLHKVLYFSDGSAAQYKKLKNLINLIFHQSNFHIHAEFFCHHGKNACDGVGGTIKRLAVHASLQCPFSNQILTPKQLFDFAEVNWWCHLVFCELCRGC